MFFLAFNGEIKPLNHEDTETQRKNVFSVPLWFPPDAAGRAVRLYFPSAVSEKRTRHADILRLDRAFNWAATL